MRRFVLLLGSVFLVGLLSGGALALKVSARASSELASSGEEIDGQILGILSANACQGDCFVRLGLDGPAVLVARGGNFELDGVASGCHDLVVEIPNAARWSFEDAVCVDSGRSTVVSIISGRP